MILNYQRKEHFGRKEYLSPPSKRRKSHISLPQDGFDSSISDDDSFTTGSSDWDDDDDAIPADARLFGDLDVESIFHPTTRDENSDEPISLDMLDWRRRVLFNHQRGKKSSAVQAIPELLTKAGIKRRPKSWKPSFDRCSRSRITEGLVHYDPPRSVHTDHKYAFFCKTLMNCLSSGAKRWAQHEFFYGDIDRGW